MKTINSLLFACFFAGSLYAQTTHIVDNNDNGIGDFSSLPAAITAAAAGDVILVVPSAKTYDGFTLTSTGKRLTIAGGGANGAAGLVTKIGAISLTGSINSTNLDGFVLGGFECESIDINFVDSVKIKGVKTTGFIAASTNYSFRVRSSTGAEIEFVSTNNAFFSGNTGLKIYHSMFTMSTNTNLFEIQTTNQFVISNSVFLNNTRNQQMILVDEPSSGMVANSFFFVNNTIQQLLNFGGAVNVINNIIHHPSYGNYGITIAGGQSYQHNTVFNNYGVAYITDNSSEGILTLASDGTPDAFQNRYINPGIDGTTYRLTDNSSSIDSGSGNDFDGTTADRGIFGGLDPMPQPLPNSAVGVSVVPSVTNVRLSLPTMVPGGKVILNVSGQSKKN
jgi:hypothetical protein